MFFGNNNYKVYNILGDGLGSLDKIKEITNIFIDIINRNVASGQYDANKIRLFKPFDLLIMVDDENIFFVFTNKDIDGRLNIRYSDISYLPGIGGYNMNIILKEASVDYHFENPFGFSISKEILKTDTICNNDIIPYVEEYYNNEINYSRLVKYKPIFNGHNFYLDEKLCFILMPFGKEFNIQEIYIDNIKPVVESIGFNCLRADDIYENRPIINTIWESINKASIIISELTGKNPNVFYELGIAHTLGKEVIMIAQDIDDVPFDLRYLKVIIYQNTSRGVKSLEKQLEATLKIVQSRIK